MTMGRVAVVGGHGKTGRAVCAALADPVPLGRADWPDLARAVAGCEAAYVIAPNLHPDEPAYVAAVLARAERGGRRAGGLPLRRLALRPRDAAPPRQGGQRGPRPPRSGLDWTILQPGAYLQNLDLTGALEVPYSPDVPFGFLDLADLGRAAAVVLTQPGHAGATYELASRIATVRELAHEAGVEVRQVPDPGTHPWLSAMFAYYDDHGLPVGTRVLASLLG